MNGLVLFCFRSSLFILLALVVGCEGFQDHEKAGEIPLKRVIAKWNFKKSNVNQCEDDKSNSPTSCVFMYEGKRYIRSESYKLDDKGKIDSVYSYQVPLGVNILSIEDYEEYVMTIDTVELKRMKNVRIEWDNINKRVIDDGEIQIPTLIESNELIILEGKMLVIYETVDINSNDTRIYSK